MQINDGLVTIAEGAALVQGNASVDWSQVLVGNLFICGNATYQITAVNSADKQLTISPNWAGSAVEDVAYAIARDFTTNHNLPLLNPGDLEAAAIFSRAMGLIDARLSTAGSTTNEIEVSVGSATSFIVGNLVGFNASGWYLCEISDSDKHIAIGMVTEVGADLLSFKIKTEGYITGIQGISLTAGSKYYITNTAVSGGGGFVNLTATQAEAGDVLVPVFIATGTNSGFLMNLAASQTATFTNTTNGLVPAPNGSTGFLKNDGTWAGAAVAADSLTTTQFDRSSSLLNWIGFGAGINGLNVVGHIADLNERLEDIEDASTTVEYSRQVFTFISNPSGTYTVTVPAGVTEVIVTAFSNAAPFKLSGCTAVKLRVSVSPGDTINGSLAYWNHNGSSITTPVPTIVKKNSTTLATVYTLHGDYTHTVNVTTDPVLNYTFGRVLSSTVLGLYYPTGTPAYSNTLYFANATVPNNGITYTLPGGQVPQYDARKDLYETKLIAGAVVVEWGVGATFGSHVG